MVALAIVKTIKLGTHTLPAALTTRTSRGKFDAKVAADAVATSENSFGAGSEATSLACSARTMQHSSSGDGNLKLGKWFAEGIVALLFQCRSRSSSLMATSGSLRLPYPHSLPLQG